MVVDGPLVVDVEGILGVAGGAVVAELLVKAGSGAAQAGRVLAVLPDSVAPGQVDGGEHEVLHGGISVGAAHTEALALEAGPDGGSAHTLVAVIAHVQLMAAAEEVVEDFQVQVGASVVPPIGKGGDAQAEGIGQSRAAA